MNPYSSCEELDLDQRISYCIRKRISVSYAKKNKDTYENISLGIVYKGCNCTHLYTDPNCRNRFTYIVDYINKERIQLKECPNRFDDSELWSNVYPVLNEIKSMDNIYQFYGMPLIELPNHLYQFINSVFQAKERYNKQKEDSEN